MRGIGSSKSGKLSMAAAMSSIQGLFNIGPTRRIQRGYAVGNVIGQIIPRRGRPIPVKRGFHIERTTAFPNRPGERECARRRKQIPEGRLTTANGLEVAHVD